MGKPNSLPTFSANLLTWKAARWLPRSPSTKVRAAPPPQGASLFELQFAPPPWATEAPFHSQHRPCTTLSKCPRALSIVLPLWPSYAPRSAARLMGVVCHHHCIEKGSSRTERRGLCDENHTHQHKGRTARLPHKTSLSFGFCFHKTHSG